MFLILGSCGLRRLSQELEIVSSSKFSTANHNHVSTKKPWAERRVDKFKGQKVIQKSTRTLLMPGLYCCNKLAISLLSWDKCDVATESLRDSLQGFLAVPMSPAFVGNF